ncbi:MAG: ADP-ribosylation factor-like protein [Promethearchaeota archaeon]
MKQEALNLLVEEIMRDVSFRTIDTVESHDFYKFKVSYITQKDLDLLFIFVTGLTDKFDNVKKELEKCRKEFVILFEDILQHRFDAKTFEVFDPIVDGIHKNLRPKISLVGFSGVGKTTITKLIRAEEIPMQHIPTITGDIATIRIGKLYFHLWDFAGQEQFSYLWNNFIRGSDAVLLITDSTLENVEKSKFFLELIKEQSPDAHTAIVGNKQDLKGAMEPSQIERILELKTYSMIAKDPENRNKMIQIIADILEMSAEVSPLLKPLLERDQLIEEATRVLKDADFDKAAFLFDKISSLCIDLGDDSLGKEFFEKSQKIKTMLAQVGAPQPTPAHPIESDRVQEVISSEKLSILKEAEITKETSPIEESKISISPPPPQLPPSVNTPQKSPFLIEKPVKEQELQKTTTKDIKESPKQEDFKKPEISHEYASLKLKPEDFMVKVRPKKVITVPKEAKSQLTISPYGQIKNDTETKETEPLSTTPNLKIESKVIQDRPKEESNGINLSETINTTDETLISHKYQKEDLKKQLLDIKIKKANLNKMALDYDMQELQGEISAEELEDKKKKIALLVKKLENQIQEIQNLLND